MSDSDYPTKDEREGISATWKERSESAAPSGPRELSAEQVNQIFCRSEFIFDDRGKLLDYIAALQSSLAEAEEFSRALEAGEQYILWLIERKRALTAESDHGVACKVAENLYTRALTAEAELRTIYRLCGDEELATILSARETAEDDNAKLREALTDACEGTPGWRKPAMELLAPAPTEPTAPGAEND